MKPPSISRLIKELRRRRVLRGVVVYGASTLVIFEAADNLYNAFGVASVPKWLLLLLAIGFFVSLWFSWIYDITPGGIRKTEPVSDQPVPIPKKEISLYKTTTFVSILIIIGLLSYRIVDGAKEKKIAIIEKSIAVLPLPDEEVFLKESIRYQFIGHQITTCLLKVKDYRVVPWEDSRRYPRKEGASYAEMGQDLSAAILVNWRPYETVENKHLSVGLISAADSSLLWEEIYEIKGSWPSEICRYSRKISKKITRELRTYLTPRERAFISEEPTSSNATMYASLGAAMSRDAWEKYQIDAGRIDTIINEYIDLVSFEEAINYFTRAILEDSSFAQAYAGRAKAKLLGIRFGFFNEAELPECEKDILKAFELDPDLPEAHIAMGFYYYYGLEEPMLAHAEFVKAVDLMPLHTEYQFYLSIIKRALGKWDEVKILTDRILEANPRNALFLTNLGISYAYLHEFHKAIECQDRAIRMTPHWYAPHMNKVECFLALGDTKKARTITAIATKKTGKIFSRYLALLDVYEENYAGAIDHIEQSTDVDFLDVGESEADRYLLKAKIYRHAGNSEKSAINYKAAIEYLENRIMFNPNDYDSHSKLGIALAGSGQKLEAIEHGKLALDLVTEKNDLEMEPYILNNLIQIYALAGNHTAAGLLIEKLVNMKSYFTSDLLKLDPDLNF